MQEVSYLQEFLPAQNVKQYNPVLMKVSSQSVLGEYEIWGADIHVFQLDAANEISENDF